MSLTTFTTNGRMVALLLVTVLSAACTTGNVGTTRANGGTSATSSTETTSPVGTNGPDGSEARLDPTYPVVDTGQVLFYDNQNVISAPQQGDAFYGQDAAYQGAQPSYVDNGDGTVTDLVTRLMWQRDPGEKMTYGGAMADVESYDLAGYDDWRLPTIKELYSLIEFTGTDPSGCENLGTCDATPFIDTGFFVFSYGDTSAGERMIDAQYMSGTRYVSTTMGGNPTVFGVNFADGRIKGYPISNPQGGEKTFFVLHVRGNTDYGANNLVDNGDGTVTDLATGLTWMQTDSGEGLDWEDALGYCENLDLAGHDDWRLPNAKELQSIVDYTRSASTTGSAAIDPVFETSTILDEGGEQDYPSYWSSTTHANLVNGANAVYVAFGEALGWMQGPSGDYVLLDVHGAGSQRSDPKIGDPADYPRGHGPQGDVIRVFNYARCVRSTQAR
jgi:hypothetical protein